MDDRKAPPQPQAMPEEDSKMPAVTMPEESSSKRRKGNAGMAVATSSDDFFDVAADLKFKPGDRVEVKWTINDDEGSEGGEGGKESPAKASANANAEDSKDGNDKGITVWWGATLSGKTDKLHTLTDEERGEGAYDYVYKSSSVKVPIYNLNYAPLEELGFDTHSLEEVAFLSHKTLLNLSTDEMMTFRTVGAPSPPSSPTPAEGEVANDESAIAKGFNGQEEMRSFMSELMQRCLKNTGMDKKMKNMPAANQAMFAERIHKAQEGMLEKIMAETDQMETGNKIITADVVRKCMSQMEGGH